MFTALFYRVYRMKRSGYACAVALVLSGVIPAVANGQPLLTFEHALRLAQDRSRQLASHDYAGTAAREMAVAAGAAARSDFERRASTTCRSMAPDRFSLTRDFMTMRSVGVMQEFTRERQAQRACRAL